MKNNLFLWALVLAPWCGWGQTVELEEEYLNKCVREQKWTQAEATERVRLWRQMKVEYPVIPYDTSAKEVTVDRVITFPGVKREVAFRRVKEWAALTFGSLEEVTDYEDAASGKIILEGYVVVTYQASFDNLWGNLKSVPDSKRLYFSLVVTVKDDKAKVEYKNLKYWYTIGGYTIGNTYIPLEVVRMPFGLGFPVTAAADKGTWKGALDLLRKTMVELNATAPSLEAYVRAVDEDYKF